MLEKYHLLEREALGQIALLPVVYKKAQYIENEKEAHPIIELERNTIVVKSNRHGTDFLCAMRFYKNIEIFAL